MDARNYSIIEAELRGQLGFIEQVMEILLARASRMDTGDQAIVEATSFQVNNYYSAVEDLLRIVAAAFENNIANAARWHSEQIDRMTLTIEGVRPALLSATTAQSLHKLRTFRHFFRHAYRVPIDANEVVEKVAIVRQVHPLLMSDVEQFLNQLS